MSYIKEAIDLFSQVSQAIQDRNILDALFPLKEKLIQIQQEIIEQDRKHWDEVREVHQINTELKDENARLKTELLGLKSTQLGPPEPDMVFNTAYYYKKSEAGSSDFAKYCPHCYEQERKCSRIYPTQITIMSGSLKGKTRSSEDHFKCKVCKNEFKLN